jgi:hypothetical protein
MFKRPSHSNLICTNNQIIINILKENHISPGNWLLNGVRESYEINPRLTLYYEQTKIGEYINSIYHQNDDTVYFYFTNLNKNINLNDMWASIEFSADYIQCPVCRQFYKRLESPCQCIKTASFINIFYMKINSVHLHNPASDNISNCDLREIILNDFFSGGAGKLQILDPL